MVKLSSKDVKMMFLTIEEVPKRFYTFMLCEVTGQCMVCALSYLPVRLHGNDLRDHMYHWITP